MNAATITGGFMESKICRLITEGLNGKEDRICDLYYNDPMFHKIYHILNQHGEDKPEMILDIILNLCEDRRNTMNELIKKIQES